MAHRLGVLIGRFQPAHKYHVKLIGEAIKKSDHLVILLGSSLKARTCKDPLNWHERAHLIYQGLVDEGISADLIAKVSYIPIRDYLYSDHDWVVDVQSKIDRFIEKTFGFDSESTEVTLFGNHKDETSYYLSLFPSWRNDTEQIKISKVAISATDIRHNMFECEEGERPWEEYLTSRVNKYMNNWLDSDEGVRLAEEHKYIKKYRSAVEEWKYPITFTTVDSVVVHKGMVLLVKRRAHPGKGLWALPGGFINQDESLIDGAIRETKEETKLRLEKEWLVSNDVFDAPNRSLRGRTITHGFCFHIRKDNFEMGNVMGGDDAEKAQWFPLGHVLNNMGYELFEDHLDIIYQLTKSIK